MLLLGRESSSDGRRANCDLEPTAILYTMPPSRNERQSLEQERGELRAQIAAYWQELENGTPRRARRELLEWQIRQAENRLAGVRVRLTTIRAEGD